MADANHHRELEQRSVGVGDGGDGGGGGGGGEVQEPGGEGGMYADLQGAGTREVGINDVHSAAGEGPDRPARGRSGELHCYRMHVQGCKDRSFCGWLFALGSLTGPAVGTVCAWSRGGETPLRGTTSVTISMRVRHTWKRRKAAKVCSQRMAWIQLVANRVAYAMASCGWGEHAGSRGTHTTRYDTTHVPFSWAV